MNQVALVPYQERLLATVRDLPLRAIHQVILYAEHLKTEGSSATGQAYIDMLVRDGASGAEILQAAEAVRQVDSRLRKETDSQAGLEDLHRRTDDFFRLWCQERGIDYDTLSEEAFDQIADQAVKQMRTGH